MQTKTVLNADEVKKAITRISHEIYERHHDLKRLALIGIRTGGAILAKRFQAQIETMTGQKIPLGLLDITLYRDDLSEVGPQPDIGKTEIDFDVSGKTIILIDDVLYTGRTIRSALDAIIDFGRPTCIQLAVFVDRGHREFPIKPDFVGKNIPTAPEEQVVVKLQETDKIDEVVVMTQKDVTS
ncbi:MAG: bifunctional pyr operon transcriptional regulator/uracil phosphoribosyltransferase [Candidatus Omnitrophica bacterium CG11_big_fil_rev_8_21_14_0_20_45_26]|uniref:Bifunctional protein PyrR n=1 Tax=Candidatus Abzuiibacterium crystallinum TaxID=1974748 RepID=A0A2H0LNY3_9BACT|nr:MAG: bifunctional pyr operon transcriptional regulator/uracil phosphoribosyltransferase [Candidatus Omnitrophica bacterium CG11_big_fil_rev_8_21_14_0_20_45_26]PIW65671.1 MAG: bifunctional pyr operon transcriptional regulator/uracil phosphoribosyltransferase PyrR [Candidatus Omnitrophica bacterium CG12_big_fil_rev_8_21_14_0_65_45_16]